MIKMLAKKNIFSLLKFSLALGGTTNCILPPSLTSNTLPPILLPAILPSTLPAIIRIGSPNFLLLSEK